jgi:hypothetical protein
MKPFLSLRSVVGVRDISGGGAEGSFYAETEMPNVGSLHG